MAYRFTDTNKWRDAWFLDLAPMEKLLWVYLCENCDIAGFYEVCKKRIMFDLGINKSTFEGALKGLDDKIIWSFDGNIAFIKNFLKHQKNLPLRENNKAHVGILRRFENYKDKFDFDLIEACISASLDGVIKGLTRGFKGASKGLPSPTGIGIGNNNTVISSNKDITISSNIDKEEESIKEEESTDFVNFTKWISEHAPNVAKLKEPFTQEQYFKIRDAYSGELTADVLMAMHNKKDLLKSYNSAYLTFLNWAKRRVDNGSKNNRRNITDDELGKRLAETAVRLEYEKYDSGEQSADEFERRIGFKPVPRHLRNS